MLLLLYFFYFDSSFKLLRQWKHFGQTPFHLWRCFLILKFYFLVYECLSKSSVSVNIHLFSFHITLLINTVLLLAIISSFYWSFLRVCYLHFIVYFESTGFHAVNSLYCCSKEWFVSCMSWCLFKCCENDHLNDSFIDMDCFHWRKVCIEDIWQIKA